MSDPQAMPDERRPVLPEKDDRVERTEGLASDAPTPAAVLPETQRQDPLRSRLGKNGQRDLAHEDESDGTAREEGPESEGADADADPEPSTEDLQEPSTEKEPGEEPKAPGSPCEPQPSHEAVGIGVIDRPQTDTDETSER